jgi:hypothetical protein
MTENFLELTVKDGYKIMVSKSSIAVLVDHNTDGCVLTLKETYPDGKRIAYIIKESYAQVSEKLKT